jgi:carboxyl-terminal processing protease
VQTAGSTGFGEEATAAVLNALSRGENAMAPTLRRAAALRAPVPSPDLATLRLACPPAEGREADLAVARALLETPAAYATALRR